MCGVKGSGRAADARNTAGHGRLSDPATGRDAEHSLHHSGHSGGAVVMGPPCSGGAVVMGPPCSGGDFGGREWLKALGHLSMRRARASFFRQAKDGTVAPDHGPGAPNHGRAQCFGLPLATDCRSAPRGSPRHQSVDCSGGGRRPSDRRRMPAAAAESNERVMR
jgi:hypothetical protein